MHPAPSVIIFTVLSGLGFGMLAFLGIGVLDVQGVAAFMPFAIAFTFAVSGLIASTFHLGNPQRALRAFSQWKTSWLSREAWLSAATLAVMGLYTINVIFRESTIAPLGWLGAVLAVATVFSTAMIYAQLKTVPRWNHWLTPVYMLTLSLAGGAILAQQTAASLLLLVCASVAQLLHWIFGDRRFAQEGSNIGSATGLGKLGKVRLFEPPHTGTNYLLKEMVHVVGRKHAQKLRVIAFVSMILLPIAIVATWPGSLAGTVFAAGFFVIGTFASRWLFFAEAEHVVGLYYGKHDR